MSIKIFNWFRVVHGSGTVDHHSHHVDISWRVLKKIYLSKYKISKLARSARLRTAPSNFLWKHIQVTLKQNVGFIHLEWFYIPTGPVVVPFVIHGLLVNQAGEWNKIVFRVFVNRLATEPVQVPPYKLVYASRKMGSHHSPYQLISLFLSVG